MTRFSLKSVRRPFKLAGFSLIELLVALGLMAFLLFLAVPNGRTTEKSLTTQTVAEELIARLRRARDTSRSKGVPVAVCIPNDGSLGHSDMAYQMEGDTNPIVTSQWQISQDKLETVFFTGKWVGPTWNDPPRLETASIGFEADEWWPSGTPPLSAYIYLPSGEVVSNQQAADGSFRIVVAQGVAGSSSNLLQASNPWTVSITPSGECSLMKGVYGGSAIPPGSSVASPPGATYIVPSRASNTDPVKAGSGGRGVYAYPDTNNPNGSGNKILALDSVLTLEVRVKDNEGDPPYFEWSTSAARDTSGSGLSPMSEWGGRFSNTGQVRMEWDSENKEWVGRTTWSPAPGDLGGNGYKLECQVEDRRGGNLTVGFPVTGWLETTREQWVLYRTLGSSGFWELWKMTLNGTNHEQVVALQGQDVIFGEWAPSGDELIVASALGVYRASSDGGTLRRINQQGLAGLTGVSITPRGDRALYTIGSRENYDIRQIRLDSVGAEVDEPMYGYSNICDWVQGLKVTEIDGDIWGVGTFHRLFYKFPGNRHRRGVVVVNMTDNESSEIGKNPIIGGHNNSVTISFHGYDADTQLVWANIDETPPQIHVRDVQVITPASGNLLTLSGGRDLFPAVAGPITFPRLTYDGVGCVFSVGTGSASQVYYMADISSNAVRRLPLAPAPLNNGARDVSISIPR